MTFAENINRICAEKGTNLTAIYKAKLKRNGVKIFYAKQPMPDTPEGIILESVLEGYAEYYSENLAREEMKKPLLTKERIMYWLESFKRGDIEDVEYQRRIIDTLVNSVYVYDDGDKGRKLVLTFNISGNNTLTISSSDIELTAPPNSANPNSFFFVKHCVGFVFIVEDVG